MTADPGRADRGTELEGRVALVAGAAEQCGAHAVGLARLGADILLVVAPEAAGTVGSCLARRSHPEEVVRQVEALGRSATVLRVDVLGGAAGRHLEAGIAGMGRLDIVVAVVADPPPGVRSTVVQALDPVFRTVRLCIPHLRGQEDGGAIVLAGPGSGPRGEPCVVHHDAVGHGLDALSRILAAELAPHAIRVDVQHGAGGPALPAPGRERAAREGRRRPRGGVEA